MIFTRDGPMDIERWIENTGERRVRKPTSVVRRRAGGEGLCKQYLACCLSYFLISGSSQEVLEQEVQPAVEQFLRERGLSLSREKTVITHIENGFDFLGQNVRKYRGKLLIKPSKESVQGLLEKVRKLVKANKQAPAGKLIVQLNPIIRGWALYHRHMASKRTFDFVDHAIFELLWQWATRRHPKKGRRWVKEKNFQTIGQRQWVFSGEIGGRKGETQTVYLINAAKTR